MWTGRAGFIRIVLRIPWAVREQALVHNTGRVSECFTCATVSLARASHMTQSGVRIRGDYPTWSRYREGNYGGLFANNLAQKKIGLGVLGLVLDKSVGLNLGDSLCEKVLFSNYWSPIQHCEIDVHRKTFANSERGGRSMCTHIFQCSLSRRESSTILKLSLFSLFLCWPTQSWILLGQVHICYNSTIHW